MQEPGRVDKVYDGICIEAVPLECTVRESIPSPLDVRSSCRVIASFLRIEMCSAMQEDAVVRLGKQFETDFLVRGGAQEAQPLSAHNPSSRLASIAEPDPLQTVLCKLQASDLECSDSQSDDEPHAFFSEEMRCCVIAGTQTLSRMLLL